MARLWSPLLSTLFQRVSKHSKGNQYDGKLEKYRKQRKIKNRVASHSRAKNRG